MRRIEKHISVSIHEQTESAHPVGGEKGRKALALKRWVDLNPERLRYQMIFTATDTVSFDQTRATREFIAGKFN